MKQICSGILGTAISVTLFLSQSVAATLPDELPRSLTTNGRVVKAYGLPLPGCDYRVGDVITLRSTGGSSGAGVKTSYVLTDASGKLIRVSTTASFTTTDLVAGDYKAYALTYSDDASITNLVANGINTLPQVSASCLAVSSAYPLTLCESCQSFCIPIVGVRIR